jgi:hypothetical protein
MHKGRQSMAIGALVVVALLAQAVPQAAGDCIVAPCYQDENNPSTLLELVNWGDGVGISAYSQNNDAITGKSSASNKSGVFGENTTGIQPSFGVYGTSWWGGYGVYGKSPEYGVGGQGKVGVYGESDGTNGVLGKNTSSGYGVAGTSSNGTAGYFYNNNQNNTKPSLKVTNKGTGWTALFSGTGPASRGVYISTKPGNKALQVAGGTKSAVVATSQGARSLYAEEASEVFFTDYGFGRLQDGKTTITIDPLFAETVSLEKDYYVFCSLTGKLKSM